MRWVMRMHSLFFGMCVCHNKLILLDIHCLSDCFSESCCFECGSKVREFGCHIPTGMSLSPSLSLLQRRLGCWVGVWQDADVQKAALLVKSYLSITRGWTKVFVRECKLGRSIPKDTHQCHHHDVGVGGFASDFMFANDFHIFVGSGTYLFVLNLS